MTMRVFTALSVMAMTAMLLLSGCSSLSSSASTKNKKAAAEEEKPLSSSELRLAESALQSGDTSVALSLYSELSQSHPDHADVWLGLADAYYLDDELEQARSAYTRAEALDNSVLDAKLGLARIAIRMRDYDEAHSQLMLVLMEQPDHPVALSSLGVMYDLTNRPDMAQKAYKQGLEAHPSDTALRSNLGLSLALNGQAREAVNVLLGHSGVSSKLPQARENLALAYGLLGRDDAAEEILLSTQTRGQVKDNLEFYKFLRDQTATKQ